MSWVRRAAIFGCILSCAFTIAPALHGQAAGSAGESIAPAQSCASLAKFQLSGYMITISKAETLPASLPNTVRPSPFAGPIPVAIPQYCRVDGSIDPHTGADGKPYAIGFAIALPDRWNGRFLFQGGGGLDGTVNIPLGAQAAGDTPALARRFAVVATDSGHRGAVFDASFLKDQQSALDFALFAFGKVTRVAKEMIAQYYGQPVKHSYFVGCSMGGREAMTVSQRYPAEFDGVVSGDPAMRTGYSNAGDHWAAVAFNQIAPKDASGKPMAGKVFSPHDRKLLVDSILEKCDAKDGLKDGMIFNTMGCDFNPLSLTCKGEKTDSCLTSAQTAAIAKAFAGPKNSMGVQIYPPFPYDTGITAPGPIAGLIPSAVPASPFGPDLDTEFDADKVSVDLASDGTQQSVDTYSWTNFSTFRAHGGKLLFYHGTSDPWFSPFDTLGFYQKMAADNGGADQVLGWSRLYFVPGMGHCQGGSATLDDFDMLAAVVDWVERGVAPDSVVATGKAFPGRSRPLCPYPRHAQYKGEGDPRDAANFACVD